MQFMNKLSRRDAMRLAAMATVAGTAGIHPAFAAGAINFADIGVGDPGGDWSKYKAASGYDVNLVSIGNAPSAILNVLVASGGQGTYDIINIVGGMQKPLVENDLVEKIDTSKMPNWSKDTYLEEFLGKGKPGFKFIGLGDDIYGVPTVLQGDSFAYLPEKTGPLDSYAALFDPKWKGYVALEDNYTTAAQKTALYLKASGMAQIGNPDDMTKEEFKTVIDFLIEQKKAGPVPGDLEQLRTGGQSDHQQGSLCDRLLGAHGVRGEIQGRRRGLCRSQGRLSALGHGGLYRQEPQSQRGANHGGLSASRFHAGRLVRRHHHQFAGLHDQSASARIRRRQSGGVP